MRQQAVLGGVCVALGLGMAWAGFRQVRQEAPAAIAKAAAPTVSPDDVKVEKATRRRLHGALEVLGSVTYDQDHHAVVGPLVSGRITALQARVGSSVRKGDILAAIDSPEVGHARAEYLAARARAAAAEANARRERELAERRISSVRDRELAEAQAAQEAAGLQAAGARLQAFGVGDAEREADAAGRVYLRAPLDGVVIERRVTLSEAVALGTDAFVIVDLRQLWILLDIYEKDLERIHVGQRALLHTESLGERALDGVVSYVEPIVDEKTRTANVRVQYRNDAGLLRPGQFVTARLVGDDSQPGPEVLTVPRAALQTVEGVKTVFVRTGDGFTPRRVTVGIHDDTWIEVRDGVSLDEEVVVDGGFLLKSSVTR